MPELIKGPGFAALVLSAAAVSVFLFLLKLLRQKRQEKEAYEEQIKNQALNQALKNSLIKKEQPADNISDSLKKMENGKKRNSIKATEPVVKLTINGTSQGSYIVNPKERIFIGSNEKLNKIVISDPACCDRHCELFFHQGRICLRNVQADRSTVLKRRNKKTEVSQKGILLYTGDCFFIGKCQIQVTLLDYTGKPID